jgi:hypothetical protein
MQNLDRPLTLQKKRTMLVELGDSWDKKTPVGADWTGEQEAGAQGEAW